MLQMPVKEMEINFRNRLLNQVLLWPTVNNEQPLNEFSTSGLFIRCFPHLFPTGEGNYSQRRH